MGPGPGLLRALFRPSPLGTSAPAPSIHLASPPFPPPPTDVLVVAVLKSAKGRAFDAFVEVAEALRNGAGRACQWDC